MYPVGKYLFKVNNVNTRTMYEICSKLTIKTSQQRHGPHSAVFIVNFEQILHIILVVSALKSEHASARCLICHYIGTWKEGMYIKEVSI